MNQERFDELTRALASTPFPVGRCSRDSSPVQSLARRPRCSRPKTRPDPLENDTELVKRKGDHGSF